MKVRAGVLLVLIAAPPCSNGAFASGVRLFVATDGAKIIRANSAGRVLSSDYVADSIIGMTVVPEGVTIAGAAPGSFLAVAKTADSEGRFPLYRMNVPFGDARLTQIGSLQAGADDLTFADGRLFGPASGVRPLHVYEFDLVTFDAIDMQYTGLDQEGAGGLAWDDSTGRFYITNEENEHLFAWTPGSTPVDIGAAGVAFQNNDLEFFGGVLYAALATAGFELQIGYFDTTTGAFTDIVSVERFRNMVALAVATCDPDCNDDGKMSIYDFTCFQSEWRRRTAFADYDKSGTYTVNDFIRFHAAFAKGCGY